MNREIKFRAWDKKAVIMRDDGRHPNGKAHMKYDVGVMASDARNEWATGIDGLEIRVNSDSFELMQYTGLKDKNGVEIFEGDIIELFWPFVGATYKTKVIWVQDHGRWAMEEIRENGIYHYFGSQDTNLMNIEVIGNIYENNELLSREEPRGTKGNNEKK